jgi:predicted PurR-regulated permease PerM
MADPNNPTNKERLASIEKSIEHIDKNIDKIANNNVNQWKQINKNAINISGMKAINGVIAFAVSIGTTLLATYFGVKHQ